MLWGHAGHGSSNPPMEGWQECVWLWKWIAIPSFPFGGGFKSCVAASLPFLSAGTH